MKIFSVPLRLQSPGQTRDLPLLMKPNHPLNAILMGDRPEDDVALEETAFCQNRAHAVSFLFDSTFWP